MFKLWSIKRLLQLWSLITIVSILLIAAVAIYSNHVFTRSQSLLTKKVLTIQQASHQMTVMATELMIRQKQILTTKLRADLDNILPRQQFEQGIETQLTTIQDTLELRHHPVVESLSKKFQQFFIIDDRLFERVRQQHQILAQLQQQITQVSELEQAIQKNVEAITGRVHLQVAIAGRQGEQQVGYSEQQLAAIVQLSQAIQLEALTIRYLTQVLLQADNTDTLLDLRENKLRQHEVALQDLIARLKSKLQADKPLYRIAAQLAVSEQQLIQEIIFKQDAIYPLKQQQISNQRNLLSDQQQAITILNDIMVNLNQVEHIVNIESHSLSQQAVLLAQKAKWLTVALGLLIMGLMILFVRSISRRINEPLLELRDAMHTVSQGQFDLRLPEKAGNSEFAVLATDFNLFAASTEILISELAAAKEAIQLREQHIQAILNGVPEAILTINAQGDIESSNDAAEEILKADKAVLNSSNIRRFLAEEYHELSLRELAQRTRSSKEMQGVDYQGHPFTMWFALNRIDAIEKGKLWVAIISDITAWQQIQQELRATSLEMQTILENAMVGIAFVKNRVLQRVNRKMAELFGYTPEELEGQSTRMVLTDEAAFQQLNASGHDVLARGETYTVEIKLTRKDGSQFWGLLSGQLIDAAHPEAGSIWLCEDVTQQRENDEKLKQLATTDVLTGLPNRALFNDRLEHALYKARRNAARVAVLFIDLDNFKHINDSLGHGAGDVLLCEVARRLKACVREEDTVARLGGDEFIIILEEIRTAQHVAKVAEKILTDIASDYDLDGVMVTVSPSIGISLYPADGRDVDMLIRNADAAMYHAKHSGKNNFQFYSAEMHQQASQRLALETALRQAVDNNEFYLHFQPQINLQTGTISGAEALLRWNNEEWGQTRPDEFVPVLEDTGLIHAVGQIVIRQAIQTYLSLQAQLADDFRIAVNLSGRQFQGGGLAAFIAQELSQSGMSARHLELEITESILMSDTDLAVKTLNELNELGITLAIDDFGTGYSSLSYLKRFPLDILKIDRSFIRDITLDNDDAAIVDAILAISRRLGLKVVAEGVESQEQLVFLRSKGCDFVQGYYFSRPLPASEFLQFVEQYHQDGMNSA